MAKENDNIMSLMVIGFVSLILAAVLIGQIVVAGNVYTTHTTKTEALNLAPARIANGAINTTYSFTLGTGVSDWRNDYASDCIPTVINYKNSTGDTLAVTTNYVYTSTTGGLTLKNTDSVNNTASNASTVAYSYCPDGYVAQSFGRTSIQMVYGLFALAALAIAVGMFYSIAKKTGLV